MREMATVAEAKKLLALLPDDDPDTALADFRVLQARAALPLASADLLLAPKSASRVTRVQVDTEHFQRAAFEPLQK